MSFMSFISPCLADAWLRGLPLPGQLQGLKDLRCDGETAPFEAPKSAPLRVRRSGRSAPCRLGFPPPTLPTKASNTQGTPVNKKASVSCCLRVARFACKNPLALTWCPQRIVERAFGARQIKACKQVRITNNEQEDVFADNLTPNSSDWCFALANCLTS